MSAEARRAYDASGRRAQASATRTRLLDVAVELLHEGGVRDWHRLTIPALAARAGVGERTLYRYFASERGLRDAVIRSLEERAGIDLDRLDLASVADVARRTLDQAAAFPPRPRPPLDPTLRATYERQRAALAAAVAGATGGAAGATGVAGAAGDAGGASASSVAAVLDVLWSVDAYERLTADWQLDHGEAVAALAWAIDVVRAAIEAGTGPGG